MGKKLPKELAANAQKLKRDAVARHKTLARAALTRFRAARDAVSHAWWEMGAALRELADPVALAALGRRDLAELCAKDLDITHATARRILAVMARVTTDLAATVTLHRAEVLIELADATPDEDTPDDLVDATLTLPLSGATLSVATASADAIVAAAKEFREAARGDGAARGLSASPEARRLLREIERAAKGDDDLAAMRFKVVASRDEEGAWLEVRVRAARAATLTKVAKIAKAGSPGR